MLLTRSLPNLGVKLGASLGLTLSMLLVTGCKPADPPTSNSPTIAVQNARVMQPLPGKTITSGYFDLHNGLAKTVSLVGASSSATSSIEMHEIVRDGEKVRMRRLQSVEIAPGATLSFQKGGKHLMLFGVSELPEGLDITLEFADGHKTAATFQQQRW